MNLLSLRFDAVLVVLLCFAPSHGADTDRSDDRDAIVAAVWITPGSAGGKEVVIKPDAGKLKAHGLTFEQLSKSLCGKRFAEGKWNVEIGGKSIRLQDVAQLTVREVKACPFAVALKDGRTVHITPDPARIGHYVVTGGDFERMVRASLSSFSGPDPAGCCVLSMISVPGNVGPHLTEKDTRQHFSLGEPLRTFAKVKVVKTNQGQRQVPANNIPR